MDLNAEQLRLEQYALRRAARAKAAREAASEEEWDQLVAAARDEGPLAALGPPGTGETSWTRSRSKCSGTGAGRSSRFPRACKPRERGSDTRRRMWTRVQAPFCSTRTPWKPWTS